MHKIPDIVLEKNKRFFVITQVAYIIGATSHTLAGLNFFKLGVMEMVWFNACFSVPVFTVAFLINRKGWHNIAFAFAFSELLLHQALVIYYIGWDGGQYFWLVYLIGLSFFNANWGKPVRILCFGIVISTFIALYLFFKTPEIYVLSDSQYRSLYLSSSVTSLLLIALLINYYVQTASKAEARLRGEKKKSEEMAELLKTMFGRYLSTEVMRTLLRNPSTLELGGEKRDVTIMMTDLRGFTAMCEKLKPEDVVKLLNTYFEIMIEIIDRYHGTVNEIIGDALLVIFGAPQKMPDRCQRAVACGIEMQNAMAGVNRKNRADGLPELEMGIGLNETEVIVGNIGSQKRSKYAVVGSGVNQTSRIESYSVGGQILISESVYKTAGDILRIDSQRDVSVKGAELPLRIYTIGGIAGTWNLALEHEVSDRIILEQQIPVSVKIVAHKDVRTEEKQGFISTLSKGGAGLILPAPVPMMTNLKMNLAQVDDRLSSAHFYCKVTGLSEKNENVCTVKFTAVPAEIEAFFQGVCFSTGKT